MAQHAGWLVLLPGASRGCAALLLLGLVAWAGLFGGVMRPEVAAAPRQMSHPADSVVSNRPLGSLWTSTATTFRVFAPTASLVELRLYTRPALGSPRCVPMRSHRDGTWDARVQGDCNGLYYTYRCEGADPGFDARREVIDPYARGVTAFDGRGIVIHDETPVADRPSFRPEEAVICELHLRDFTIDPDSGIRQRGRYLGLAEGGTRLHGRPDIRTGLDHLEELGVNTVQVLPLTQFCTDEASQAYGWGYDALHFNSPHGGYASERWDGRRVAELKRMIDALHRRGIRVVLDVVFNHTVEDLRHRVYSFEGLVPGYYYRRRPDGSYFNGSGCGNEFRSEAPMARRFIMDSVRHWVEEYKVDGFRFDLMGLIDRETMGALARDLRAIDPNLLIHGEPWASGETPITVTGKGAQRGLGFSVFNDHFRDALKGSVFHARERGFIQGELGQAERVRQGMAGAIDDFADQPVESINYLECHDNHTLWDRIGISTAEDARIGEGDRRAMDRLGAVVLFTSQGIPFFQAGQEMLRSKGGDDNSYDKPDAVNMIRWARKVENRDIFEYYRGLIALRRAHPLFRLGRADRVRHALRWLDRDHGLRLPAGVLGLEVLDASESDAWARALVLLNPGPAAVQVPIPGGRWEVFVDDFRAGTESLGRVPRGGRTVALPARSGHVLGEPRARSRRG